MLGVILGVILGVLVILGVIEGVILGVIEGVILGEILILGVTVRVGVLVGDGIIHSASVAQELRPSDVIVQVPKSSVGDVPDLAQTKSV